jgi:Na+/proline symporter
VPWKKLFTFVGIYSLIVFGLFAMIAAAIIGVPASVGIVDGFTIAAATGRLKIFDFSFDLTNQYTFWSGTIAALFLFCSYFGADQSQVQRYLTARSVEEAQQSLLMSAYWKIPLQFIVLLLGVLVFVFYVFNRPPVLFSHVDDARLRTGATAPAYTALEAEFATAWEARRMAAAALANARDAGDPATLASPRQALIDSESAVQAVRTRATDLARAARGDRTFTDINYIIPTFILTQLPVGLVGLLMAAIFAAAMSTIAGELSALSTSTVIDFYRRWVRDDGDEKHLLLVSKFAMLFWALFASVVAIWAVELGSLIEVVNRFGSFFYGSILGVFLLAIGWSRANSTGAFVGLIVGMSVVGYVAVNTNIAFLWHNLIGAVVVFGVGMIVSALTGNRKPETGNS